mmetsp:Transcript_6230/g.8438  ORF Transcript_6230/g.8438 Transcript_6230/m.8438 type:complete len:281 (-) Transcript_6230:18-860(-)
MSARGLSYFVSCSIFIVVSCTKSENINLDSKPPPRLRPWVASLTRPVLDTNSSCFWTTCSFNLCPDGFKVVDSKQCDGFRVTNGILINRFLNFCCSAPLESEEEEEYDDELCISCPRFSKCNKFTFKCECHEGYQMMGSANSTQGLCRLKPKTANLATTTTTKSRAEKEGERGRSRVGAARRTDDDDFGTGDTEIQISSPSWISKWWQKLLSVLSPWTARISLWSVSCECSWSFLGLVIASALQFGIVLCMCFGMVCSTTIKRKPSLKTNKYKNNSILEP